MYRLLLILIVGVFVTGPGFVPDAEGADGLPAMTAHFPLNEGRGTVVADVISGVKGEVKNSDDTAWISSPAGIALKLDGIDQRVIVPNSPGFDFSDESFSVSFHVRWKENSTPHHQHFICKGDYDLGMPGETGKRWEINIRDRGLSFILDDSVNKSEIRVDGDTILKSEWVHVVAIRDSAAKKMKLYLNGEFQASNDPANERVNGTDTTGSISNPRELVIADSSRRDNALEGELTDVRIFRAALADSQVAALAKQSASANSTPSMTAHFPLDEGRGEVITDVIGGLKGSLVNVDATTAWISGKIRGALDLDGANDRIFIPHSPALDFADESFTVSFWMRWPEDYPVGSEHIICKGDYSSVEPGETGRRWELYIAQRENMTFVIDDDVESSRLKVPLDPYITGEWVHVAMVRDTGQKQLKLYANGVLQQTIDPDNLSSNGIDRTGSISNPQRLTFGDAHLLDNPFAGDLDDLRIFRLALTDEQIAAMAK